jgi:integrase
MLAVIEGMQRRRTDQDPKALVFSSPYGGGPLTSVSRFLDRSLNWKTPKIVVHGFRSTLADWCRENGFAKHLIDIQLDHMDGTKIDQPYFRGQAFEQRRQMMAAWGEYCDRPTPEPAPDNVAQITEARKRRRAS